MVGMTTQHDNVIRLDDYRNAEADCLRSIDERAFREMQTLLFGVEDEDSGPPDRDMGLSDSPTRLASDRGRGPARRTPRTLEDPTR